MVSSPNAYEMTIILKRRTEALDIGKMANGVLHPDGGNKANELIRIGQVLGRRDPLTQIQQKILTTAISLIQLSGKFDATMDRCKISVTQFLNICNSPEELLYSQLVHEIEKISRKGVWLYESEICKLSRTQWFQLVEYTGGMVTFQFTDKIMEIIIAIPPDDIENQLIKGIQYKGKHTRAVFEIIESSRGNGLMEYSISELMKLLSLEHTRYSYGQLKLRVLEPSLQEIYSWDTQIFVRFGPTFSGRRAEGIWFEVFGGEEARDLRKNEPNFKFALPEDKPIG